MAAIDFIFIYYIIMTIDMMSVMKEHGGLIVGLLVVGSFLCMTVVFALGALLFPPEATAPERKVPVRMGEESNGALPVRVVIEAIGVDATVHTPATTDVRVLDQALSAGAVHYPGSGVPGEGNMLLFGHSTSLSNVINQAYRTFNGVQHLEKGDDIIVYSAEQRHVYKVLSVALVRADEALVDFSQDTDMLTLSTCNTFGAKQERFVVEADYIGSFPI